MDHLAAAQAALNAGRTAEAIEHLTAAIQADPARPAAAYRVLTLQLYQAGRYAEGEAAARQGLDRYPNEFDLANLLGVLLRRQGRYADAVPVLERAVKINPKNPSGQINLGNVLLDSGQAQRAEQVFARLARQDPRNAEIQRQLGRALLRQGKREAAFTRLRSATTLRKDFVDAWLDMIGWLNEAYETEEAEALCDKAIAQLPNEPRLREAKAVIMRRAGQSRRAEAYLTDLIKERPNEAWLQAMLGSVLSETDRERGNAHLRRAVELEPNKLEYQMSLVESLERTRSGDEGANIEEAYQLARKLLGKVVGDNSVYTKVMFDVLSRVCDFDALQSLGDLESIGRTWARTGRHTALMKLMSQVRTREDRLELIEQHRIWGRAVEATAGSPPARTPRLRPPGAKIRLGLMSSDIRQHPVGYFTMPLFEHLDRERFEVFVYSYYSGQEDPAQRLISTLVSGYRWWPDCSVREAAARIAADDLDMLIELGGSTYMNKLEVMAYRPAPLQASWLGYPHSAGLEAIDYFVSDPQITPPDRDLLLEKPLELAHAWYPLSGAFFRDEPALDPEPPIKRNGYVTFGTANQPHKCTCDVQRAWARIMARCPESRFLFIRPESSSPSFQRNIRAVFGGEGIEPHRVEFEAVRGKHLPHYNRIDISLDTFPQTGGTTTCESMWMGAPCVTLVGPAPYERLSYSVLTNVGLPELCAFSLEEYEDIAVRLGSDPDRIAGLRAGMRARMRTSPLGQDGAWAADFYDAVARAVEGGA